MSNRIVAGVKITRIGSGGVTSSSSSKDSKSIEQTWSASSSTASPSIGIGRGMLDIDDSRVSERQVEIKLLNSNKVTVFQCGVNPSFIQSSKRFNEVKSATTEKETATTTTSVSSPKLTMKDLLGDQLDRLNGHELQDPNGEVVSFLIPNQDPIHILIQLIEDSNDDQVVSSSSSSVVAKPSSSSPSSSQSSGTLKASTDTTSTTSTTSITSTSKTSPTKRESDQPPIQQSKKYKVLDIQASSGSDKTLTTATTKTATTSTPARVGTSWSDALSAYCLAPADHSCVKYYDDKIVIIQDAYPKAKHHYLVMPRRLIPSFKDLTKEDLGLLQQLYDHGIHFIQNTLKCKLDIFQIGFHAVPSMRQLHLHLISNDLNSPALKRKEHWISFTTDFFIPFQSFYDNLKQNGSIVLDREKYKKLKEVATFVCPKCKASFESLAKVKDHYQKH
ncbi:hypothetical protein SAMD00019534_106890 [Acytostelium subglobosum LB1]|uniref:hypothetical protein n=1 Tax=Acytostelium subglobosum LB1 TaxID=1410327 RepID=UPI000644D76F|nr:hypothetical protein SAMD00019534_106890 [Acytostelium subglobosum LB1]GAM27513.1 hypothetical protein SAMD00019534_106890 [Acytostelium subglobosum LB1]|eukprot:XP_012749578.1 hypothetical protein SAMD00019534_106890 [Acytostelium subglobosum LB1]